MFSVWLQSRVVSEIFSVKLPPPFEGDGDGEVIAQPDRIAELLERSWVHFRPRIIERSRAGQSTSLPVCSTLELP